MFLYNTRKPEPEDQSDECGKVPKVFGEDLIKEALSPIGDNGNETVTFLEEPIKIDKQEKLTDAEKARAFFKEKELHRKMDWLTHLNKTILIDIWMIIGLIAYLGHGDWK